MMRKYINGWLLASISLFPIACVPVNQDYQVCDDSVSTCENAIDANIQVLD